MEIDVNKIKNYALAALSVLFILAVGAGVYFFYQLEDERTKLTAKDAQIQQLDSELGLSKSSLVDANQLNDQLKKDLAKFPEELRQKIKEYELQLQNRDETIAALRNEVKGGHTDVVVKGPREDDGEPDVDSPPSTCVPTDVQQLVIAYAWEDDLGRFHLVDPDIFIEDNERFTSTQYITVVGHVFYGKDGNLQVKKVEIQEVIPSGHDKSGKPVYKAVPGSNVELVDSKFEYVNTLPVRKRGLLDVITLRPFASFDTALTPGLGIEWVNLGRLIDYANFGFNTRLALDVSDVLGGSLQSSRIAAGIQYQLVPPFFDTNLAIGASVGMPFNHIADINHMVFTIDAIFYLTPDLNPFSSRNQ